MLAKSTRLIIILAGPCLAFTAVECWAAKAPLSAEQLRKEASHIVSGKVVEVTVKDEKSQVEMAWGIHHDRVFTIKLKVTAVAKGTGVKAGDEIKVRAWKPVRRIPPLAGLQGHESIPNRGDTVTVYVEGKTAEAYQPILPNGIVIDKKSRDSRNGDGKERQPSNQATAVDGA